MATYKDSGVDISAGDAASQAAYTAAKNTFPSREGMFASPVIQEGGFAGALDFGDYYMITNCDGTGTKIDIAIETENFEGLGYDLLAMTADDAICVGAEVVAITNTFDTNKINPNEITGMMKSLEKACIQEKVTIPGGEIAELGNTLNKTTWNSSCVGVVEKEKFITGNNIQPGDAVIALKEEGFRSNGFSLVRYILKENDIDFSEKFDDEKTWGEKLLTPCTIYHRALLESILGSFKEERKIPVSGVVHVTGGGLAGNFFRILKNKGLGANLPNIWEMPKAMQKLQEIGDVEDKEAYKTWNGGNGMLIILPKEHAKEAIEKLQEKNIEARVAGEIIEGGKIFHANHGFFAEENEMLEWTTE